MQLSTACVGRDNNLNLLRFTAASAVLVSHSFVLSSGLKESEPLQTALATTPGAIAVDAFFVVSGFLVTASLIKSESAIDYCWSRMLRILPGLLTMLLVTAFVLGPSVTSLTREDYFKCSQCYVYVLRSVTLFINVGYVLPGVFNENPYPNTVNGSLWTIPCETRMCTVLLGAWIVSTRPRLRSVVLFKTIVVMFAVVSGFVVLAIHVRGLEKPSSLGLLFMFFTGSSFYILRRSVRLSVPLFAFCCIAIFGSCFVSKNAFCVVYMLTNAYVVLFLAFVPGGTVRHFNLVGDYSYGVYLYSFPVQQTVAYMIPGVSLVEMVALSGVATLLFAMLSWHLVEKQALKARPFMVRMTRRLLVRAIHFDDHSMRET